MNVLVTLGSTAHYGYHESTIQALRRGGHTVRVLFATEGRVSPLARVLERDGGTIDAGFITRRADRWRRPLFAARALRSYSGYLRNEEQSDYYRERWEGRLGGPLQGVLRVPLVSRLLATRPAFRALGAVERLAPAARSIVAELERDRPDVVVVSPANLRNSEEVEYLKAARSLGIPCVLPVLSWDNLTTKGLIHVAPDLLLAWNDAQRAEAIGVHGIDPGAIAVTGSPFFDPWFDGAADPEPRDAFCRRVGLDPERPFAVYLGSSANIAHDETWLVRELVRELKAAPHPELRSLQVLVRPHPANAKVHVALDEPDVAVWPKAGRLPDSEASREEFRATLAHAVGAVGINTSGMIDAVIAGRPCIAIVVRQYDATQRDAIHFRQLADADTLELADGPRACTELLRSIMGGTDSTRAARGRFVEAFVRPLGLGTPAGAHAARAIELAAEGLPGHAIEARLTEAAAPEPASV